MRDELSRQLSLQIRGFVIDYEAARWDVDSDLVSGVGFLGT